MSLPTTEQAPVMDYKKGYKELQAEWKQHGKEMLLVGRLAYWTFWISKCAEVEKDPAKKRQLFTLKANAFKLLMKSEYTTLQKAIPKFHQRVCYKHYGEMKKSKDIPGRWLYRNFESLIKCKRCREGERHFFSLYSLAVLSDKEVTEDRKLYFVLYSPHPLFKEEFPDLESLPRVKKFGRELASVASDKHQNDVDLGAFKLDDVVLKYYFKNYEALNKYFN